MDRRPQPVTWAEATKIAMAGLEKQERARQALAEREAAAAHEDVEVWRPTPEEWAQFTLEQLQKLGLTYAELEQQARDRDFQSPQARDLWVVIGRSST